MIPKLLVYNKRSIFILILLFGSIPFFNVTLNEKTDGIADENVDKIVKIDTGDSVSYFSYDGKSLSPASPSEVRVYESDSSNPKIETFDSMDSFTATLGIDVASLKEGYSFFYNETELFSDLGKINGENITVNPSGFNDYEQISLDVNSYSQTAKYDVETTANSNGILNRLYTVAQGFNSSYLSNTTLGTSLRFSNFTVQEDSFSQPGIQVLGEIWNATKLPSGNVIPGSRIGDSTTTNTDNSAATPLVFKFSTDIIVNQSNTFNNETGGYFFFVITHNTDASLATLLGLEDETNGNSGNYFEYIGSTPGEQPSTNNGTAWGAPKLGDIVISYYANFTFEPLEIETEVKDPDGSSQRVKLGGGYIENSPRTKPENYTISFNSSIMSGLTILQDVRFNVTQSIKSLASVKFSYLPTSKSVIWVITLISTYTNSSLISKYFYLPNSLENITVLYDGTIVTKGTDILTDNYTIVPSSNNQTLFVNLGTGNYTITADSNNLFYNATLATYVKQDTSWIGQNFAEMGVLYPNPLAGDEVKANITNFASVNLSSGEFNSSLRTQNNIILGNQSFPGYKDTANYTSLVSYSSEISFSTLLDPNVTTGIWTFQFLWTNGTDVGSTAIEFNVLPVAEFEIVTPSNNPSNSLEGDTVTIESALLDFSHNSTWATSGSISWDFGSETITEIGSYNATHYLFRGSIDTSVGTHPSIENTTYAITITFSDGPYSISRSFDLKVFYRVSSTFNGPARVEYGQGFDIEFTGSNDTNSGSLLNSSQIIFTSDFPIIRTYTASSGLWNIHVNWNDSFVLGTGNQININWTLSGHRENADIVEIQESFIFEVEDTTKPTISSPGDGTMIEDSSNNIISWSATDQNPATYSIFLDNNATFVVLNQPWSDGIPVELNIDDLLTGVYNFTIFFDDVEGNSDSDTIFITVSDIQVPIWTTNYIANVTMIEDSTSNILNWQTRDKHPSNYSIRQDGFEVKNDTWANITTISWNVDYLKVGEYNFTIIFLDESGNMITNTVFVLVTDETVPTISGLTNLQYEETATGNTIELNVFDTNNNTYTLYRDNAPDAPVGWNNGFNISINIDNLADGVYNYTIVVSDDYGNSNTIIVIITVVDTAAPILADSPDQDFEDDDSTGPILTWVANDINPDVYQIYLNNNSITGLLIWEDGATIIHVNPYLITLGDYNFTIIVFDEAGNFDTDTIILSFVDTTTPTIDQPTDFSFEQGSTGEIINWIGDDLNANNYSIYVDDVLLPGQIDRPWTSTINVNFSFLDLGVHNITIIIMDTSLNKGNDTVIITVTDTTTAVILSPGNQNFEETEIGTFLQWNITDFNPDNFTIFVNGSLYLSGIWSSNITINVDNFELGNYTIQLFVEDINGNQSNDSIIVIIFDGLNPQFTLNGFTTYEQGVTGNTVELIITDLHASNYSLYIEGVLNITSDWVSGVGIIFNLDGYAFGSYNYTIIARDSNGLENIFNFDLIVLETTSPIISSSPSDFTSEQGVSFILNWTVSDLNPNNYDILVDESPFTSGLWINSADISIEFIGLVYGPHNITLIVFDVENNPSINQIIVTIIDTTSPTLTFVNDFSYPEGSINNEIVWLINDFNPGNYSLIRGSINDTSVLANQTLWSSGSINIDIDGLLKGVYNYTISFYDIFGNLVTDIVIVSVIDTTLPEISEPSNFNFGEDTVDDQLITWSLIESYPSYYEILENDNIVRTATNYTISDAAVINVQSLKKGVYNYTIRVFDLSDNMNFDTVIVTVFDITSPTASSDPTSFDIVEGTIGNLLEIIAFDTYNSTYTAFFDAQNGDNDFTINGNWNNSIPITLNLDDLVMDIYNITVTIFDTSGLFIPILIIVTVLDMTTPSITSVPIDVEYIFEDENNQITWTIFDLHPFEITIYLDNVVSDQPIWNETNKIIVFNVDGLTIGDHNVTLVLIDSSGNFMIDYVNVVVKDPAITDTEIVIFNINTDLFEGDVETIEIIGWQTNSDETIFNATVTLRLFAINVEGVVNGTEILSQEYFSGVSGLFSFVLNYTSLNVGEYLWEFSFQKPLHTNLTYFSQKVTIFPHNLFVIIELGGELVKGEDYPISATVTYNNPSPGALRLNSLNRRTGSAIGIELNFEISFIIDDGSLQNTTISGLTNQDGIATIQLSGGVTAGIQSIEGILVSSTNEFGAFNPISITASQTDLPNVVDQSIGNAFLAWWETNLDFINSNITLFAIGLIIVILIFMYITRRIRRRKTRHQSFVAESENAAAEIDGIRSIRAIIMTSGKSGIPFYEQSFEGTETRIDLTLVSGMTSAISAFMNELEDVQEGFETMVRAGLTITSHKSEKSLMIIVSKSALPLILLEQLMNGHGAIETRYKDVIGDVDTLDQIDPYQVTMQLQLAGFKLDMKTRLNIDKKQIKKIQNKTSITRKIRSDIKKLQKMEGINDPEQFYGIDEIIDYLKKKGLKHALACRVFYLAYAHDVIYSTEY